MKEKNKVFIVVCVLLFLSISFNILTYRKSLKLEEQKKVILNEKNLLKAKVLKYGNILDEYKIYKFKANALKNRYPNFDKITNIVYRKSIEYGFKPELILALIKVESDFDQYAISSAGAYGLMQINYSVWKNHFKIDPNKLFDIEYNIDLGLKILKYYYDESGGNLDKALFRYNNGYLYKNKSYVKKVVSTYNKLGKSTI